ncbi:tetratricopeptide repeat protein [Planctomicrobium piriforme]|uniref:Tetratricopeptide repeat-containing protein n=1 Tax=Planctomicrobium piriforme TaxID=1576369 RepID=A0A1I3HRI3_9PLAN|nr:tetratricopeptide repeat protein [Planctomicrobium piriforme]SFI38167.1 Tetratricopeptide repeat-containing protein [Planctomicrobium piriforme]
MTGTPPSTSSNDHYHHAPEQTELEKALNKGLTKAEPYSNQLLMAFIAVAVILVGGIFWYRSTGARQTAGWDEFAVCRAPDDYLALADKYPNLPVGEWSRLQAGRQFLAEGLGQALTNRASSDERLNKALGCYEQLVKLNGQPNLREEALYGLATCREALSDGDDKPAIEAYEQLLNEFPDSQHRLWAQERVNALKTKTAEGFYAWFRKQNPKPADRPKPQDIPSTPPEDGFSDLKLPTGTPEKIEAPAKPPTDMSIEIPKPMGDAPKDFPPGTTAPPAAPATPALPVPDAAPAPKSEAPATPATESKPAEQPAK